MESLESEKNTLTVKLSDPTISNEDIMKSGNRLAEVVSRLEEITDRWLELSEYI
jgi:hypothetical protein